MVVRLERDGFIERDEDKTLAFTESGREHAVPLADVEVGAKVRILRFENEAEDLLKYLKESGIYPGLEGTLADSGEEEVTVDSDGAEIVLTRSVAETVSVAADPSPPPR